MKHHLTETREHNFEIHNCSTKTLCHPHKIRQISLVKCLEWFPNFMEARSFPFVLNLCLSTCTIFIYSRNIRGRVNPPPLGYGPIPPWGNLPIGNHCFIALGSPASILMSWRALPPPPSPPDLVLSNVSHTMGL